MGFVIVFLCVPVKDSFLSGFFCSFYATPFSVDKFCVSLDISVHIRHSTAFHSGFCSGVLTKAGMERSAMTEFPNLSYVFAGEVGSPRAIEPRISVSD